MNRLWIFLIFLLGMYVYATSYQEGMASCPNLLIPQGERILLYNTNLKVIPGVNPIVFQNLEEYTNFVKYQEREGIYCPVLVLQPTKDAQNNLKYQIKPSLLVDATRNDPPYNTDSYPGFDPHNQSVGEINVLDQL